MMDKEKKRDSDRRSYLKHRTKRRAKQNAQWREKMADPIARQKERDRLHALYLAHKDEVKARTKKWQQENRERVNELSRMHPERKRRDYHKHREKRLAAMREWRLANPELDKKKQRCNYEKHRAKRLAAVRAYEKSLSPERRAELNFGRNKRRRAKVKGAEGKFTWTDYQQILIDQSYHCYWCYADISDGNDHADHKIPLARGGSNWPSNIVASCATCNQEKSTKLPEEFVQITTRTIKPFPWQVSQ